MQPLMAGARVAAFDGPPEPSPVYNLASPHSACQMEWESTASPSAKAKLATDAKTLGAEGDMLVNQSQYRMAIQRFKDAVELQPCNSEYHFKLAHAAWRATEMELVEPHLLEAAFYDPFHPAVHDALGLWFAHTGRMQPALDHSATAVALEPVNSDFAINRAGILAADAQCEESWKILAPYVVAKSPNVWVAKTYAKIAGAIGQVPQATEFVENALANPALNSADRSALHFAAAALLDSQGRYDAAFDHAGQANRLGQRPHNPAAVTQIVNQSIQYFTRRRLKSLPQATHGNARPVFIVGMPRSGTSLVEQTLASHPRIFGAGELRDLSTVVQHVASAPWTEGKSFPAGLDLLTMRRANELASRYLRGISSLNSTASYVTDKMPTNFLYLGAVQLLLPDCRIIHCTRNPMDTCLSCYFTDFAGGHSFSFDLDHLASYYRDYQRLMEHWKSTLSVPMLEVRYEDMIADQPGQIRRMLEFLDLPWDDRCLAFHKNKRSMPTASREQVRRPVYGTSVGRSKHYGHRLGPVSSLGMG